MNTSHIILFTLTIFLPPIAAFCLASHFGFSWYLFFGLWSAFWILMPQVRLQS